MSRILITAENGTDLHRIATFLRRQGFTVSKAYDDLAAVTWAPFAELVVLDLDAPALDGFETCRRIRSTSTVPIVGAGRHGSDVSRVLGLCSGLTGHLDKPFDDAELLRSVRTALGYENRSTEITHGPLWLSRQAREVKVLDRLVSITRKEFDLLHLLASDPNRVFTRREIMYLVWKDEWANSDRTIDTHVSSLRRKLGLSSVISTVRGVGFRIGSPDATTTELSQVG